MDNTPHDIKDFEKQLMKFFTPSFLAFALFIMGGMMFKSMTPSVCGTILPDDSIFVLTGDARRIPFAMRQMRKYPDADLYIIGAGAQGSFEMAKKVTVESDSKSTYQNAIAIRGIAQTTGLDRIVIITTEDHMNRAQYLIRHELPDVDVVPYPVRLTDMTATKRL